MMKAAYESTYVSLACLVGSTVPAVLPGSSYRLCSGYIRSTPFPAMSGMSCHNYSTTGPLN